MLSLKEYIKYCLKEANWINRESRDTFHDISKLLIKLKLKLDCISHIIKDGNVNHTFQIYNEILFSMYVHFNTFD